MTHDEKIEWLTVAGLIVAVWGAWRYSSVGVGVAVEVPGESQPVMLGGGGGVSLDLSAFSMGGGSDSASAPSDYSGIIAGLAGDFSDMLHSATDSGNDNMFPLFGYAAGGGDVALRYTSNVTVNQTPRTVAPYQPGPGAMSLSWNDTAGPSAPAPATTGIYNPVNGLVQTVLASNAVASSVAANNNARARNSYSTASAPYYW